MRKFVVAAAVAVGLAGIAGAMAETEIPPLLKQDWSFNGVFGTYDRAAAQRGFQVYNEVCSNCHSLRLLSYRNLEELGFSEAEVKAISASKQVTNAEPNDQGEMFQRPGRPSDSFVSPFPNEKAARASNNGALPPDLSLIIKARVGGPDYVYSLMHGYGDPPAGVQLGDGMNYNKYFAAGNQQIAMPQPISDNSVTYADGTPATLDQEAYDVATFLSWASEPNLEQRHRTGLKVILFLVAMSGVLYGAKRKIWSDVEH